MKEVEKTRHVPQRMASSSIFIGRTVGTETKVIKLPKPKEGGMYTPTEMCKFLMSKAESSDRQYFLKHLSNVGLVGVKYRQGLRQLQIYKEGGKLP
eukprot:10273626-Ditylum_brightwellii.AAC.2